MTRYRRNIPTLVLLAVLGACIAHSPFAPAQEGSRSHPLGAGSAGGDPYVRKTPLEGMGLLRPDVPIIAPEGDAGLPKPPPPKPSPPGSQIVHRRATIARLSGGWFAIELLGEPDGTAGPRNPHRILLPNGLLEEFEKLPTKQQQGVFRVTGDTTEYRGKNFLLLQKLSYDPDDNAPPAPPENPAAPVTHTPSAPVPSEAPPANAPDPAGAPDSPPDPGSPAPDPGSEGTAPTEFSVEDAAAELLEIMRADRLEQTLVAGESVPAPVAPAPSVAPAPRRSLQAKPGQMVVDRVVRVVREEGAGWAVARFEADNTLQEQPMRLLPNHLLVEPEQKAGAPGLRWRITGEVTQYKGRRYLLLRKCLVEHDLGQF